MRAIKIFETFFLFIAVAVVFTSTNSCTNRNNKGQNSKNVNEAIRREVETYAYPLPSAFEVSNMLNEIEAKYLTNISNSPKKAPNYFTEKSKALNLGIYAADLAYATTYNKKDEIHKYLAANETLIRELDFAAAFDKDIADRIENNYDNKDQLVEIITEMFQNAYSYLNQQGRTELSYLVLVGTIIEGLYLTTHISENTFQNPKIIAAILFQKKPLENLQKMLDEYKDSELITDSYRDILQLNEIYSEEPGYTAMTEKQLTRLTEKLTWIRSQYVNKQ